MTQVDSKQQIIDICSNHGVFGEAEYIADDVLALIQQKQLEALPDFAKPGGLIMYETINGKDYVSLEWLKSQLSTPPKKEEL